MMTCREVAEMLFDFVADQLPAERLHSLEEHLRRCSHCGAYVETYRITIQLSRRLPPATLPPELSQRLQQKLSEPEASAKSKLR